MIRTFIAACLTTFAITVSAADMSSAPIRVGLTTSLTGSLAEFGQSQKRGVELWAADVNDRGYLLGRKVEVVMYDDASSAANVGALYEKLVNQDKVDLLISPYSSSLTLAAAPVAERYGVPMMSIASASDIWKKGYKNVFGLYTPANANMDPVLRLAKERELKTVALVYLDEDFPRDVADGVRSRAGEHGLSIVLNEAYGTDFETLPAIASRVAQANADVVIVASYLDDAIAFAKAAKTAGVKPKIFAFSGAPAVPDFVNELGEANVQGMLSTVQWTRGIRLPGSFDMSYRYERLYNGYPNYDVAGAYAAGQVLEQAVRLAGSTDRAAVREQLATLKTRTILGNYRVDETGAQTAKTTYLIQCQEDHLSLVYPPEVARFPLVYPYPG